MATTRLQMVFQNAGGRQVTLTLNDPRPDVTTAQVQQAMNDIIAKNVFQSNAGDSVGILGACLITQEVTNLKVA